MSRKPIHAWTCAALLAALLLATGCGPGPGSPQAPGAQLPQRLNPATAGTLSVNLVQDGLPGDFSQLNLALSALELRVAGVWWPVPLPATVAGQPINILAGTSQAPLALATNAPWPEGLIDQMRFTLGPSNSVVLASDPGATHALTAPTQFMSAMGLPGSLQVNTGLATNLWISFDVDGVIQPDPANSGQYLLEPGAVRGYDKAQTGSIHGTLSTEAEPGPPAVASAPIGGAVVTAQMMVPAGTPGGALAFRTTVTAADGSYTLDLLPAGYTWCVVSQPLAGGKVYVAQVGSGPAGTGFAMDSFPPYNSYESDLSFPAAVTNPGTINGKVGTPAASGTLFEVGLIQNLPQGDTPFQFVLRSVAVAADGTFTFDSVPPGIYGLTLNADSLSSSYGLVDTPETTAGFVVTAVGSITVHF